MPLLLGICLVYGGIIAWALTAFGTSRSFAFEDYINGLPSIVTVYTEKGI